MNKLFVIGSGFTKGLVDTAPLNDDLLEVLSTSGDEAAAEIIGRYGGEIEGALTRLDLDLAKEGPDSPLKTLRERIEISLASFFRQYRIGAQQATLKDKGWIHPFLSSVLSPGDVVVSLNYDCLFEGLVDQIGLWSPNEGYGFNNPVVPDSMDKEKSPITVLKIHGSENFRSDQALNDHNTRGITFGIDDSIFPRSGAGVNFFVSEWKSKPGIIAPSYVKVFPSLLIGLYLKALAVADSASQLILIGCSVRREDQLLHTLIWQFIRGNYPENRGVITIVDPRAREIFNKLHSIYEYPICSIGRPIEKSIENGWHELAGLLKE